MAVVIAALLPVFLLIVLGFILKRSLMRLETQWHGLERLTYYVLFPTLLIQTLVKADLTEVPVAGVGGALLLSALVMSLLCLALRPLLARWRIDGPAFTSIFQGATRWQTYVALAVSGNLYGDTGLALASVAMVAIIPLVNVFSVCGARALRLAGKAIGPRHRHDGGAQSPDLGLRHRACDQCHCICRCQRSGMRSPTRSAAPRSASACSSPAPACSSTGMFRPSLAARVAVFLKLVLMPVLAIALALWFGLSGANLAIVAVCSAVPTSSSAYVLARQMGGDAPLLAQIITLQTILAAITMPIVIALVAEPSMTRQPDALHRRGEIVEAVQRPPSARSSCCDSAGSRTTGRSKTPRRKRTSHIADAARSRPATTARSRRATAETIPTSRDRESRARKIPPRSGRRRRTRSPAATARRRPAPTSAHRP